ncbi:hypothetical protein [Agrobacterium rosae]|uniref:hypothetical protein n=1 Tax=Agrobacterium rosae TaxID=1972867 RepID=UPI001FED520B|nr:hypothetical protein [Agrobacterium rosae]
MEINLTFGSWCPDMPDLNNPGVTLAHNVTANLGTSQGSVTYGPLKRASLYSATSMASRPLGTAVGSDKLGASKVWGGCASALYKIEPETRQWQNISRAGGYSTAEGEVWATTEYGNAMFFTNFSDELQYVNADIDTQFANATTLVRARHIATVKDNVIVGNTYDALDGEMPFRVRWSGLGLPLSWDFSQSTGADFQDVYGFGAVQAIVGGEAGWLLMEEGVVKMTPVPYPYWFAFDPVPNTKGCSVPQSVITVEGVTYYIGNDGFYRLDGDRGTTPIGIGKVDKYFLETVDVGKYMLMSVAEDPRSKHIYWSYASKDSNSTEPDKMLIFNYVTGDWTTADATTDMIFRSTSLPWTIGMFDIYGSIDAIPASPDSPIWAGGNAMLWGMSNTGALYVFGGENMPAVIETAEQLLIDRLKAADEKARGDRSTINRIRVLFDGSEGSSSVRIGQRGSSNAEVTWTEPATSHPRTQWAYVRATDRFQRFRINLTDGWTNITAMQIDAKPAG